VARRSLVWPNLGPLEIVRRNLGPSAVSFTMEVDASPLYIGSNAPHG
jgi:hypothetical protein